MKVLLYYAVAGTLEIHLDGLRFEQDISWPNKNVLHHNRTEQHLKLESTDLPNWTNWGVVELVDINLGNNGFVEFIINTHHWGEAECAHYFVVNGVKRSNPIKYKSGVRGPIGEPSRSYKVYQKQFQKRV